MMPGTRAAHSVKGFTLVELLVVLAIIAVLAGAVVPYARRSFEGASLQQAGLDLAQDIKYAESLAIDRGRAVRIFFDSSKNSYRIELAQDAAATQFAPAPGMWDVKTVLPDKVRFDNLQFSSTGDGLENVLVFEPNGLWSTGQLSLRDENNALTIQIGAALGDVRTSMEHQSADQQGKSPNASESEYAALLETPL